MASIAKSAVLALVGAATMAEAFAPVALPLRPARTTAPSNFSPSMVSVTVNEASGDKQFQCESGDILREEMLRNKVELYYTMKGKVFNCGGGGNCGTCKVELMSGSVTPRTDAENKLLSSSPASYRLACQTCVTGNVVVRNKPDA